VLALPPDAGERFSEHERCTLLGYVHRLAALRGDQAAGFPAPGRFVPGRAYFVPQRTLTAPQAAALGIAGPEDLFGGVVPHGFVATKAISHPLVDPAARAVAGWNPRFGQATAGCVLQGYTVFEPADARVGGRWLLARGRLRLKPVRASGSRGQVVVRDAVELQRALEAMDEQEIADHGLVLEEDLEELHTFSIGQVQAAGLTASYFGVQRATHNNAGLRVYGGSDLTVVRGGYEALLALRPPPAALRALEQARRYDAAVHACYPGFLASRSNYDILVGRDAAGALRSAVLEQSWRAGGATGAELAALERLQAEPRRQVVRASTHEVFGYSPEPPAGATVYYRGIDPHVGPLTKYTTVEPA
jgi:hypothetical protein